METASSQDIGIAKGKTRGNEAFQLYSNHFDAQRSTTAIILLNGIRELHPQHHVTVLDVTRCNLLDYAKAGNAEAHLDVSGDGYHIRRIIRPGSECGIESEITLDDAVNFGKYNYYWHGNNYLLYVGEWEKASWDIVQIQYILSPKSGVEAEGHSPVTDELIVAASKWLSEIHDEIEVFDDEEWTKDKNLWKSVQKSTWDEVILDSKMKESIVSDVEGFFDRKDLYAEFGIPWKRGIIFHGTPGNGKTMSLKSLIHSLSIRRKPIPALYIKSLKGCRHEQSNVQSIFCHAREVAPCLLIFEDVDSLVTDNVRSYFLNEVDGLASNDGILMIGSTNHLGKLDPAISSRPSRFDRKYHFGLPGEAERTAYCEFWRRKLSKNPSIDFPTSLSPAIARITNGFSFAYLKELFISALFSVLSAKEREGEAEWARSVPDGVKEDGSTLNGEDTPELPSSILGRAIRTHLSTLRKEMTTNEASPSETLSSEKPQI